LGSNLNQSRSPINGKPNNTNLRVPILKGRNLLNLLKLLPWYLLMEGDVMTIEKDMMVEKILNALIVRE